MSDVVSDRMLYDHLEQLAARQDEAAYLRCQVQLLTDEVERLRLTEAERKALMDGIYLCEGEAGTANEHVNAHAWAMAAGTLRGLLERLK